MNRGTRYCAIEPFRMCPSANSIASNSAPPSPCTTEPFDLVVQAVGVDDRAALEGNHDALDA